MKTAIITFLIFVSIPLSFSQETKGPSPEKIEALKLACASDVENFCKNSNFEKGPLDCLKTNLVSLSSECQKLVSEIPEPHTPLSKKERGHEKMEKLKEACSSDVEKFCSNTEKGRGGPIDCLKKNIESLSSACKTSVNEVPEPPAQKSSAGKIMDL